MFLTPIFTRNTIFKLICSSTQKFQMQISFAINIASHIRASNTNLLCLVGALFCWLIVSGTFLKITNKVVALLDLARRALLAMLRATEKIYLYSRHASIHPCRNTLGPDSWERLMLFRCGHSQRVHLTISIILTKSFCQFLMQLKWKSS